MLRTEVVGALALAAATVAVWWLWLGRDTSYQIDPRTQVASGPYEAPQVIGCALSVLALAVIGGLLARPWLVVSSITSAFTVAWTRQAMATDDSGLWVVGAVMVLVGVGFGTAIGAFGAGAVRRRRAAGVSAR